MLARIRQKAMVNKAGMIEISAADLPRGTWVEVIVLVDLDEPTAEPEQDETAYLLSTSANRQRPQNALKLWSRRINDEHRLIYAVTDEEIVIVACRFHD